MRVAITVRDNYITPAFDVSRDFLLLAVDSEAVVDRHLDMFTSIDPLQKASPLKILKVNTLICGAISPMLAQRIANYEIKTIPCVAGDADVVIGAYLAVTLPDTTLMVPGCSGNHSEIK